MNLELSNEVQSKDELADFIDALHTDLLTNPDEWENSDLERFLSAMAAWVRSVDRYSVNSGDLEVIRPSWSTFAKILCAAKVFE